MFPLKEFLISRLFSTDKLLIYFPDLKRKLDLFETELNMTNFLIFFEDYSDESYFLINFKH